MVTSCLAGFTFTGGLDDIVATRAGDGLGGAGTGAGCVLMEAKTIGAAGTGTTTAGVSFVEVSAIVAGTIAGAGVVTGDWIICCSKASRALAWVSESEDDRGIV